MVLGNTEDSQPALPRATDKQGYSLSFDVHIQEDSLGLLHTVPLITIPACLEQTKVEVRMCLCSYF